MDGDKSFELDLVQPDPAQAHKMPYAPAIHVVGAADLMFVSGATPSPLYHNHPHVESEHDHPNAIEDQVNLAMANIKMVLDSKGATWQDVVKVTKYLTDMRDFDGLHRTLAPYFGNWQPASTTICVNQLSSPGARVELDMIVALGKKG